MQKIISGIDVLHLIGSYSNPIDAQDKWIPVSRGYRPLVLEKILLLK